MPLHASRRTCRGLLAALVVVLAIGPSTTPAAASCFEGASDRLIVELLFGRNIENRLGVSERAFKAFIDAEVTPRFPDGFTLLDTRGQFRDTSRNVIVREPGKYLMIALADESRDVPRVREVIEAYKARFRQQSVGLIARRACVAF